VKTRSNLVEVINSAHSPLPEVVSEDVVAILILVRISLSLVRLSAWGVDVRPEVDINIIESLRRSESQVVVAWSSCLAETTCLSSNKASCILK